MMDEQKTPSGRGRHLVAVGLVGGGVTILAAVGVFVWVAFGFRQSFTSTLPPVEEMIQGVAVLTPFVLLALLMIGYGRRMLRKE